MRVKKYGDRFKVYGGRSKYYRYEESKTVIVKIQEDVSLTNDDRLYADYLIGVELNEGLWSKNKALYGFLGGTPATHKWNWKDMRDLDAAYRLTYINSPINNGNGIIFNGINNYANTNLNTSSFSAESFNISYYQRRSGAYVTNAPNQSNAMGTSASINQFSALSVLNTNEVLGFSAFGYAEVRVKDNFRGFVNFGADSAGNYTSVIGNLPSNNYDGFRSMFAPSEGLPNGNYLIGSVGTTRFDNGEYPFISIGQDILTYKEALQKSHIVTTAQKILNRA